MRYQIHKGTKHFGVQTVFENIQFQIKNNEKIAVVGRNGCGKTTLLKIMADVESLDQGEIHKESGCSIGYLAQMTFTNEEHTVEQELKAVFHHLFTMQKQLNELTNQMLYDHSEALLERYAKLSQAFEEAGGYTYESEMMNVFTRFGFQQEDLRRNIHTFSGGQKTRLAFVKLLLSKPDILLLDEPTNHLDLETIEWLENYIKRYPKAVVLVSHDRMFLDDVVDIIYEIEYGVMRKYPGNYANYLQVKKSDLERQKSAYVRQQKEVERIEALIEKFRYKKSKASFAQSKIKYLERMERMEKPSEDTKTFHANFVCAKRGGNRVLEVKDLTIGYDEPLCTINLEIMQKERVAVIGPNGKGKSTFVKTIMGQLSPLHGEYLFGHQIEPGYFDQNLAQFDSNKTVLEEVWDEYDALNRSEIRTILGSFLFEGEDVFKTVDCLSGGEKVRLSFVKLVLEQPNFLILDEPTNHLDLLGKEALEEALQDYDGTMLFVSHDRYFIQKLATAILVIDDGKATYYPMGYQDYLEKQKQQIENAIAKNNTNTEKKVSHRPVNYNRQITKLEKIIEEKEKALEHLKELRFEPEYYQDYQKMQELDKEIDMLEKQINEAMQQWEMYSMEML